MSKKLSTSYMENVLNGEKSINIKSHRLIIKQHEENFRSYLPIHGRMNYKDTKPNVGFSFSWPLYCTFSLTSSPLPPFPMYSTVYRQCVTGGGGVEMYCGPYSAGVLHSVSDHVQNLQNCFTTPNKMTSEDDIKGWVSLKFLRPCSYLS
jgi:hypothetical protein